MERDRNWIMSNEVRRQTYVECSKRRMKSPFLFEVTVLNAGLGFMPTGKVDLSSEGIGM